jgi:DNA polymerase-3 subunit delta'
MAWYQILGHEREKKILQRAILEGRVAHAYLLWGPEGIGKDALAIEFAKTVNCECPVIKSDTINACDSCKSCRQMDALSHNNLQFVHSMPAGKASSKKDEDPLSTLSDEQIEEIKEQLALKAKDKYHKLSITNANQIKIASIRQANRNLALSGIGKGRRILIILAADEMSVESANAFLKNLEEPHSNVTIFLITSRHDQILQTIKSRCQQIKCSRLSDDEVVEGLQKFYEFDEINARIAAVFGQGSLSLAKDMLDEDMKEMRFGIIDLLRSAMKKNIFRVELLDKIDELTAARDKNKLDRALNILLIWMRDVALASLTNEPKVINIDQKEVIQKFAAHYNGSDFSLAILKIEEAIKRIRQNINPQLALVTLFLELRDIFLDKTI